MIYHPRTIAPLALALAGLAVVAPAEARPATGTVQVRVHYHLQELESWGGAEAVYRRIGIAARRGCQPVAVAALVARVQARKCRDELVGLAVARVGSPVLAAVHDGSAPIRLAARR